MPEKQEKEPEGAKSPQSKPKTGRPLTGVEASGSRRCQVFGRAKDETEAPKRFMIVDGKKVRVPKEWVWSEKENDWVAPPTIDDHVTNKQIRARTYNRAFYESKKNVEKVFDEGKWPEALRESLKTEQQELGSELSRLLGERLGEATLLDCGCGTGRHLPWAVRNFGHVMGMDYSKAVLGFAADKVAKEGGYAGAEKVHLIAGDLKEIPSVFPDSIDVAICLFNTLGVINAEYHADIMAQVSKVLKMPTHESPSFFFFSFYIDNENTKQMQEEYYTKGFGYKIKSLDVKEGKGENERHYALARHPKKKKMTLKSQRFTEEYIRKIIGENFGILKFQEFGGIMAYAIAVPVKDKEKMGKELLEAVKAGTLEEAKVLLVGKASTEQTDPEGNTPLAIAAKNGSLKAAEALANAGADINAKNLKNETPLMLACENGNLEIAQMLINFDGGPPVIEWEENQITRRMVIKNRADINGEDAAGESALMKACKNGHEEVVKLLFDNGAYACSRAVIEDMPSLVVLDRDREEPRWRKLKYRSPLLIAAENGHADIVKLLREKIENGREKYDSGYVNNHTLGKMWVERDSQGNNAIVAAAKNGHLEIVKMLFERDPRIARVTYTNIDGTTPLMAAASQGRIEVVEFLLRNKEHSKNTLNQKDENGKTALMHALAAKQFEIAKKIIEAGGDPNISENDWGWGDMNYPLHMLWNFSDDEAAELAELMIAHGAQPEKINKMEETPLTMACRTRKFEWIKALLRGGANPNNIGDTQDPPIFVSCYWSSGPGEKKGVGLFMEFMKAGADPYARNKKGESLLHVAAKNGNIELAKVLLEQYRMDVNAKNAEGHIPLDIAHLCLDVEMVELLSADEERYEPEKRKWVSHHKEFTRMLKQMMDNASAASNKLADEMLLPLLGKKP